MMSHGVNFLVEEITRHDDNWKISINEQNTTEYIQYG